MVLEGCCCCCQPKGRLNKLCVCVCVCLCILYSMFFCVCSNLKSFTDRLKPGDIEGAFMEKSCSCFTDPPLNIPALYLLSERCCKLPPPPTPISLSFFLLVTRPFQNSLHNIKSGGGGGKSVVRSEYHWISIERRRIRV